MRFTKAAANNLDRPVGRNGVNRSFESLSADAPSDRMEVAEFERDLFLISRRESG